MTRVFVVQEPTADRGARVVDISPAASFGELVFLYPSGHLPMDWAAVVKKLREQLADFSDDDYLVCTGHPVLMCTAAALAAAANEGRVRYLRWQRPRPADPATGRVAKLGYYQPTPVSLWDGLDIEGAPAVQSSVS